MGADADVNATTTTTTAMAAKRSLLRILRLAHAGERAAALAYRGHARSVKRAEERDAIARIEAEEWAHRARLGEMLAELGARPARFREARLWLVGRVLGLACFVSGWFLPMWGAGRIERRNIQEYLDAAAFARAAGHDGFARELLAMARVELEHEHYFRARVQGHFLLRLFPLWPPPPDVCEDRLAA
jgi:Ubiquinone biosynthesis protein COQ7